MKGSNVNKFSRFFGISQSYLLSLCFFPLGIIIEFVLSFSLVIVIIVSTRLQFVFFVFQSRSFANGVNAEFLRIDFGDATINRLVTLHTFFGIHDSGVGQILEWNKTRDSIVKSNFDTDGFAGTIAGIKMVPDFG